jgi:electron transfer flavoprotein beta subunit
LTLPEATGMVPLMKILVCVKQVPESESPILIDPAGWIQRDAVTDFKINRLDEFAVEAALLLKQTHPNAGIDVITAGPDRSAAAIRRALGMGADEGIHIVTASEGYLGSFEIAAWIAEYAQGKNYDLILTGAMSEDNLQGQVGPMLAARLDFPWATSVILLNIAADQNSAYVEREIEGGNRDIVEIQLPAVLTVQSGINSPRYPSLSNLLRANKQDLKTIHAGDLSHAPSHEDLVEVVYPKKSRAGEVLQGSPQEKAARLLTIFHEKALL